MQKLILVALLLGLVATIRAAREGEDSWDNLKQLQLGQKIEVTDMNFKAESGRFLEVSQEAISFRTRKGELKLERPNVLRVRSSEGSHRTRWTLIGMGVGAASGAALGVPVSSIANEGAALGLYSLSVAIGTVTGAAIGAALSRGPRTVYKAQRRSINKAP